MSNNKEANLLTEIGSGLDQAAYKYISQFPVPDILKQKLLRGDKVRFHGNNEYSAMEETYVWHYHTDEQLIPCFYIIEHDQGDSPQVLVERLHRQYLAYFYSAVRMLKIAQEVQTFYDVKLKYVCVHECYLTKL